MKTATLAALTLFGLTQPALANIDIQFDYSYDTTSFFTGHSDRQVALDAAAAVFETRLSDNLSAITSGGNNHFSTNFFNPASPHSTDIALSDQSVATNVIRVYVGGSSLGAGTLGIGGHGGYSCSGEGSFCSSENFNRGQGNTHTTTTATAVDFAPWGGSIGFNSETKWNFSVSAKPASSQIDFYSVAIHELGHLLGFGTADSFNAHIANGKFSGSATGTVNLSADSAHWASGTKSFANGVAQEAAMTTAIGYGQRKYFTELDFAALKDIGWQVTAVPEADTWAMFIAGLGLIGLVARRRRQ
jgi:hypothetical protein